MIEGLTIGVTNWPKLIFLTFYPKKSPRRLILLKESAETFCVISSKVNISMGILIRGLLTAKVFFAERTVHLRALFLRPRSCAEAGIVSLWSKSCL